MGATRMGNLNLEEIGTRISCQRKLLGYTQEQLAAKMGVSIQMVSNLERGIKSIRIDNLVRLCQILQVSTDYILTGKQTSLDSHHLVALIASLPDKDRRAVEILVAYFSNT